MNCTVIIDERTSIPYCVIRSRKIVSDETLKDYTKQWMKEYNDNCFGLITVSNYRYIIMNTNDAPKLKNVCII